MRLLFTGTFPAWGILLLFIVLAAYTVFIYSRHRLQRPWSIYLPVIRITALGLLLLTLFQPVWSKMWDIEIKGKIPILLDNSGSMSIVDSYDTPELIRIGYELEMFPKELRDTNCKKYRLESIALQKKFIKLQEKLSEKSSKTQPKKEFVKIKNVMVEINKDLKNIQKKLIGSLETNEYLKISSKSKKAGRNNPRPVFLERWNNVPGNSTDGFTKTERYPDNPDIQIFIPNFQIPTNNGEAYGCRLRTFISPPVTGNYTFTLSSDDQAQLYLSVDRAPENKKLIANISSTGDNTSSPIYLEKGKLYYAEVHHKEGIGDDYMTVSWKRPDGKTDKPIPKTYLVSCLDRSHKQRISELKQSLVENTNRILTEINTLQTLLMSFTEGKNSKEKQKLFQQISDQFSKTNKIWRNINTTIGKMQYISDACLGETDLPVINDTIKKLKKITRLEFAKSVLDTKPFNLCSKMNEIGDADVFTLSEPVETVLPADYHTISGKLPSTRIGSVLYEILNKYGKQPIAGVILLSDGNNNSGKSFPEIKKVLNERDIPLFSVGIGRVPFVDYSQNLSTEPKDISINSVLAPTTSFKNDKLNLSIIMKRTGYEGIPLRLKLTSNRKILKEHVVAPGSESIVNVDLSFIEKESGLRHYKVEVGRREDEVLGINNSKTFSVNIITDPVKALFIDEYPRWESRYLNMMLKRDPRIDVQTIFIASTKNGKLPIGNMKGMFPGSKNKLFTYDILILGDINPGHFTGKQLKNITDFVQERGGTLILMAGSNYMPSLYTKTPLGELFPFKAQPRPLTTKETVSLDNSTTVNVRLHPTDLALSDNLVQIGSNPAMSKKLWQGLPGMNWVQDGIFPSKNAAELIKTDKAGMPVIFTAFSGLGKILYIGSDSFWKWRNRIRWKYHHRFWGQIILWATLGKTTGKDKFVKLMTARPEYSPDETVIVKARVLDSDENALEEATVSAEIFNQNNQLIRNIQFVVIPNSGGEYRAQIKGLSKGTYRIIPKVSELEKETIDAEYSFEIKDIPTSEYIDLGLNQTDLKYLSKTYRHFTRTDDIIKMVPEVSITEHKREDREIWDSFYFLGIVAVLLTLEWCLRKKNKLV